MKSLTFSDCCSCQKASENAITDKIWWLSEILWWMPLVNLMLHEPYRLDISYCCHRICSIEYIGESKSSSPSICLPQCLVLRNGLEFSHIILWVYSVFLSTFPAPNEICPTSTTTNIHIFTAHHQAVYAMSNLSVHPSGCPSHCSIVSKWGNTEGCCLHRRVVQCL